MELWTEWALWPSVLTVSLAQFTSDLSQVWCFCRRLYYFKYRTHYTYTHMHSLSHSCRHNLSFQLFTLESCYSPRGFWYEVAHTLEIQRKCSSIAFNLLSKLSYRISKRLYNLLKHFTWSETLLEHLENSISCKLRVSKSGWSIEITLQTIFNSHIACTFTFHAQCSFWSGINLCIMTSMHWLSITPIQGGPQDLRVKQSWCFGITLEQIRCKCSEIF